MLTRLKVNGFKNLVDVDVRFGPFTCVAGANGVGKSNLFDAIRFLSALAEKPLLEAALSVRGEGGRISDIRDLFHHVGDDYVDEMSFEAEMIVPHSGYDELVREITTESTLLRYIITLAYRKGSFRPSFATSFDTAVLDIVKEELSPIKPAEATNMLLFGQSANWSHSVVHVNPNVKPVFSMQRSPDGTTELLMKRDLANSEPENMSAVVPASYRLQSMLSTWVPYEPPAKNITRQEMRSWRVVQLEPSALRRVNTFGTEDITGARRLGTDGSHLAATLYRVAHSWPSAAEPDPDWAYAQIAGRLYQLLEDVEKIWVERDDRREEFTLYLEDRHGTTYSGRQLSDSTLRMIALATLELDTQEQGLICIEEPENGVHPRRIPAMIDVLRGIAVDTDFAVGDDNPLRQVIVNTHSPEVVQQVPDDSLLIAELRENIRDDKRFKSAKFSCLSDTWRAKAPESEVAVKGDLLVYLNPVIRQLEEDEKAHLKAQRVVDRPDVQWLLPETTEKE